MIIPAPRQTVETKPRFNSRNFGAVSELFHKIFFSDQPELSQGSKISQKTTKGSAWASEGEGGLGFRTSWSIIHKVYRLITNSPALHLLRVVITSINQNVATMDARAKSLDARQPESNQG